MDAVVMMMSSWIVAGCRGGSEGGVLGVTGVGAPAGLSAGIGDCAQESPVWRQWPAN